MNTGQLINELKKQKEMLGKGFFNEELLEKYLNASYLNKYNKPLEENPLEKENVKLSGIDSLESLKNSLAKIYPYKLTNPRFKRIKNTWDKINLMVQKNKETVNVSIIKPKDNGYQKTFKQEKAA